MIDETAGRSRTQRRRAAWPASFVVAVLVASTAAAPAAGAAEGNDTSPATITVTAADQLVDPGPVEVAGNGFTPGETVEVQLCLEDRSHCDEEMRTQVPADDAGAFEVSMQAVSMFGRNDFAGYVDCRLEACSVVADGWSSGSSASVPVSFGPLAPGRGRYRDQVFPATEVTDGIVYRTATAHNGEVVDLKMVIHEPAGDTATERPVVLWMPGGGFDPLYTYGEEQQLAGFAFDFARRGYVSASISYRTRAGAWGNGPQQIEASFDAYDDALAAVQWLRDHAEEYRIDTDAIAAGGISAGGAIAFHFAYGPGQFGPDTPAVAAALPMSAGNFRDFGAGVPEPGEPPVLAQNSVDDQTIPGAIDSVRSTCEQATQVGNVCELIEFPGAAHVPPPREMTANNADFLAEHMLAPRGYLDPPAGPPTISVDTVTKKGSSVLGLRVDLADAGGTDGPAVAVDWGDGTTGAGAVEQRHTYDEPGRYDVAVGVTGADGTTATWEDRVVVGCTIVGTDGDDDLVGTEGGDVLCGLGGDDRISGLGLGDFLYGGRGDDILFGGDDHDLVVGGEGHDRVVGGAGDDLCSGEVVESCSATK